MIIVGVDPGKVTGLAVWWNPAFYTFIDDFQPLQTAEVTDHAAVIAVLRRLLMTDVPLLIACERFVNQPGGKLSAQPEAPWVIGAIRSFADEVNVKLVFHAPGPAKKIAPDSLLRRLGWYTPGGDGHANDAARHIVMGLAVYYPETFAELTGI